MEEYENLKEMVQMIISEEKEYLMFDLYTFSPQNQSFLWIEEINSNTSRKGNYYKAITYIGNTVKFYFLFATNTSYSL